MVNYKLPYQINASGFILPISYNTTWRELTEQTAGSSAADAMYSNNAVFSVPAGQTLKIQSITIYPDATGGGTLAVYEGATEDATTTLKQTFPVPLGVTSQGVTYLAQQNIAAGKFITIVPSTTTVAMVTMKVSYE